MSSRRPGFEGCRAQFYMTEALRTAIRRPQVFGDVQELRHATVRYCTFAASTSGVEQTFSRFARIFGNQKLCMSQRRELNAMKLVMDTHEEEVDQVLDGAREIWATHCGSCRCSPYEKISGKASRLINKLPHQDVSVRARR